MTTRTITQEALADAIMRAFDRRLIAGRIPVSVQEEAASIFAALPAEPTDAERDALMLTQPGWQRVGDEVIPNGGRTDKCWSHHEPDCQRCPRVWMHSNFVALNTPAEPAGAGLREAHNMLRRIIGAYRNPQADDPHALGDEIAGAEAFLRRATLAATPVGRLVCLEGTLMKDCAVTGCPTHDAATPEGK